MARVRRLDVSRHVNKWWTQAQPTLGFWLRHLGGHPISFHSREFSDAALRPTLALKWADGRRKLIEASADAAINCSSSKPFGTEDSLFLAGHSAVAIRFDVRPDPTQPSPVEAQLWLTRVPEGLGSGSVFEVQQFRLPMGNLMPPNTAGLASRYPMDIGLERDPQVLFVDRFAGSRLARSWAVTKDSNLQLVDADPANGFVALDGQALRVTIEKGAQVGADLRYRFRQHHESEPEEVYFRYYLRLSHTWTGATDGGKLPGLAGTYGRAGWGGRGWDGLQGWSLRGSVSVPSASVASAPARVLLGTYGYHSDSGSTFGQIMPWADGRGAGLVDLDRWVSIEQRVKLNAPGRKDGVLEVWVDGVPALTRTDLRLRDLAALRIEEVWMNIFHGGTQAARSPMHAYIDNVVVARSYIGPMRK